MAELHLKLGEYSLASEYCDKALTIRKKAYGKINNHPGKIQGDFFLANRCGKILVPERSSVDGPRVV